MWLILIGVSVALVVEAIRQNRDLEKFMDEKKPAEN
jgi:hypothetical protein